VFGFQSIDSVLASLSDPVKLTLYVTPKTLPEWLLQAPDTIQKVGQDIQGKAKPGSFAFEVVDPDDPNSQIQRQALADQYGMKPIPVGLFSDQSYYLHMVLQVGDQQQLLIPSGDLSEATVRTAIESAIKQVSPGFLKTIGLWVPPATPTQDPFGQEQASVKRYNEIVGQLRRDYAVQPIDLTTGQVQPGIDVLLVVAPQNMTEKERYAIDQYLMRGGSVVVAAGNYILNPDPYSGAIGVAPVADGLRDLLAHYGVNVGDTMVLDPQNEPFPVQVARDVGGFQVSEIQAVNYPFFVDVRTDGMDQASPILANLQAVTLNWTSPVTLTAGTEEGYQVTNLLHSTSQSWLSADANVTPDMERFPELGFPVGSPQQSYPLAVSLQGSFESFFKAKPSPLQSDTPAQADQATAPTETVGTIEQSPDTTRLVVIGSAEFLNDVVFNLSMSINGDRFVNSLQFVQNAVDWSVEDLELLDIRARGASARMLKPLTEQQHTIWEAGNYLVALLGLVVIGAVWQVRQRSEKPMKLVPREELYHDRQQSQARM